MAPVKRWHSLDLRSLTTAVKSCNRDIHNCTDDNKLLSPSFMVYGTAMALSLPLSLEVGSGGGEREGLVEPPSRKVWDKLYTPGALGLTGLVQEG